MYILCPRCGECEIEIDVQFAKHYPATRTSPEEGGEIEDILLYGHCPDCNFHDVDSLSDEQLKSFHKLIYFQHGDEVEEREE